jgi:hypothetical protein
MSSRKKSSPKKKRSPLRPRRMFEESPTVENFGKYEGYSPPMKNFRNYEGVSPPMKNFRNYQGYSPPMRNFRNYEGVSPPMKNFRNYKGFSPKMKPSLQTRMSPRFETTLAQMISRLSVSPNSPKRRRKSRK